jgi:holo-[acyl-carrier protein] synthase
MILGTGIDIVEVERLAKVLERRDTFIDRVFTPNEQAIASEIRDSSPFYAGRWAAKEAISKALGVGIGEHCGWQDMDIGRGARGEPVLALSGTAANTAEALGIARIHISISHELNYACASAIAESAT